MLSLRRVVRIKTFYFGKIQGCVLLLFRSRRTGIFNARDRERRFHSSPPTKRLEIFMSLYTRCRAKILFPITYTFRIDLVDIPIIVTIIVTRLMKRFVHRGPRVTSTTLSFTPSIFRILLHHRHLQLP